MLYSVYRTVRIKQGGGSVCVCVFGGGWGEFNGVKTILWGGWGSCQKMGKAKQQKAFTQVQRISIDWTSLNHTGSRVSGALIYPCGWEARGEPLQHPDRKASFAPLLSSARFVSSPPSTSRLIFLINYILTNKTDSREHCAFPCQHKFH